MISIIRFMETAYQRAKVGTSGYDSPDEFKRKVQEVQTEAIEFLSPFYETNQKVRDALGPFVKTEPFTLPSTGYLEKPSDYVHFIGADVEGFESYPLNVNEVAMIKRSPIRKPDAGKHLYYHYQSDDMFKFLPELPLDIVFNYIRKPNEAQLNMVPVDDDNDDYLVPGTDDGDIVNLEWPESMFNLLLYMFLEKLGIEMKENLLVEYANLGIQKEAIKQ